MLDRFCGPEAFKKRDVMANVTRKKMAHKSWFPFEKYWSCDLYRIIKLKHSSIWLVPPIQRSASTHKSLSLVPWHSFPSARLVEMLTSWNWHKRERISYKEWTRRATKPGSHRYASGHTHIPCDESRDPLQQRSVEAYLALIYPNYWSLPWP